MTGVAENSEIYIKNFVLERLISADRNQFCNINSIPGEFKEGRTVIYDQSYEDLSPQQRRRRTENPSIDEDDKNAFEIIDLNEENSLNLSFQFLSILQNQNQLRHLNAYYLLSTRGFLVKTESLIEPFWEKKENKQLQNFKNKKEKYFWYMYKMLINKNQDVTHIEKQKNFYPYGQEKEFKRYQTQFSSKISAENAYLVEKLSKAQLKELYFLKSLYQYLIQIRAKIDQKVELKRADIHNFGQKMSQFENFLYGAADFHEPNEDQGQYQLDH